VYSVTKAGFAWMTAHPEVFRPQRCAKTNFRVPDDTSAILPTRFQGEFWPKFLLLSATDDAFHEE
jgi:hypothetical protein